MQDCRYGLLRIPLPRLSEKGSKGGFEGGFGRYEEAEKGSKRAFTRVCRATPGVLPRLFGRSLQALG